MQNIAQSNDNEQSGDSYADATGARVEVVNDGDISAGGKGINAVSEAVAIAKVEQEAEQENQNSQSADLTASGEIVATQAQNVPNEPFDFGVVTLDAAALEQPILRCEVGNQTNCSGQEGYASAYATSDEVWVTNDGDISAGDDGISAEFERGGGGQGRSRDHRRPGAEATSRLRRATRRKAAKRQDRSTTTAKRRQSTRPVGSSSRSSPSIRATPIINLARPMPASYSDEVWVTSQGNITAEGDGINAESKAVAIAEVDQDASQENINNQSAECSGGKIGCLSTQEGRQNNDSTQTGFAVAAAYSDKVTVVQKVDPHAGEDGIDAASTAVAEATVAQNIDQSNSNSTSGELHVDQYNTAYQGGAALAFADSDEVNVEQHGPLSADGDGIRAVSQGGCLG